MRNWSKLARCVRLCLVLSLSAGGVSFANIDIYHRGVFRYPGLWPLVVIAAILALEAVAVAVIFRIGWLAPVLIAILANSVSVLSGLVLAFGLEASDIVANIIVELPLVVALVWLLHRIRCLPKISANWRIRAVLAGIIMNVASAPVIPAFEATTEVPRFLGMTCQSNLAQLATAVLTYERDHGALLPVSSMTELEEVIQPYLRTPEIARCPGFWNGAYFPTGRIPLPYECVDFHTLPGLENISEEMQQKLPIVWDNEPRHGGGRNIAFLDGHANWHREPLRFELAKVPILPNAAEAEDDVK